LEQVEEFKFRGRNAEMICGRIREYCARGMDSMEENVLVFDRRWSLVLAGTAWFAALMCMLAYALTAR
jgi:hypothetical protein